jgi:predicted acylesterase/phospholipase RssA
MLQRLLNERPALWDGLQARMFELLPIAVAMTTDNSETFEERFGPDNYLIPPEESQEYMTTQFQKRMRALERARQQTREELEQEVAAEIEQDEANQDSVSA